jgi:hypothetical protein
MLQFHIPSTDIPIRIHTKPPEWTGTFRLIFGMSHAMGNLWNPYALLHTHTSLYPCAPIAVYIPAKYTEATSEDDILEEFLLDVGVALAYRLWDEIVHPTQLLWRLYPEDTAPFGLEERGIKQELTRLEALASNINHLAVW